MQKYQLSFPHLKVIERQIFKKSDVFFFHCEDFFALFSKAPFGQIVMHDLLKTAYTFDPIFKRKIKRNLISLFFLDYQPFTQTFFCQHFWKVISITSAFFWFLSKRLSKLLSLFFWAICLLVSVVLSISKA